MKIASSSKEKNLCKRCGVIIAASNNDFCTGCWVDLLLYKQLETINRKG
jgi:hypothetical protein